jgi:peptide/nickel transport system substrate-binding protein
MIFVVCLLLQEDTLIYARGQDSTTLDPAEVPFGDDAKVTEQIYETLVTYADDSVDLVPGLAASWEHSKDGRTWTFRLRQDVRFHDGSALDGEAVAFTFRRLIDENHPHRPKSVPYADLLHFIRKVDATGLTVTFTLKEPHASFLPLLATYMTGIVSPGAVRKHGEDFGNHPSGMGPFRLQEWRPRERLTLERFDGYWGRKPALRKAVFVPVADVSAALRQLKNGEVHVVDHLRPADAALLKGSEEAEVRSRPGLIVAYLGFNMKKHPYSDPGFRRAVSLALDRAELIRAAYAGQAVAAKGIVPPAIWRDCGELPPFGCDLELAKDSLSRVKLDGPVELWHMSYARPYMPEPQRVAEYIKAQLAKIGLDVRLQEFDKTAYLGKTRDTDHPMYLLGWSADYADPENFLFPLLHGKAGDDLNASFFNHEGFNRVLGEAVRELDPARRKKLYLQAAELYREVIPTLPLVHANGLVACSKRVEYAPHPARDRLSAVRIRKP